MFQLVWILLKLRRMILFIYIQNFIKNKKYLNINRNNALNVIIHHILI
jgi:hypothetical protein